MAERARLVWYWLDGEGRPIPSATCSVRQKGTATDIVETIFAFDDTDTAELTNPFTTGADGKVEFYLTTPDRVDIFLSKSGYASQTIPVDVSLASDSGAPTTADYLVGTANASLSAEIVVGTSPGGELGGTWASPTVDATHSGSAHTDFIAKAIVDAKGDIVAATAADTVSRLAVGANDTVLTADSAQSTGLKWAAAASGSVATDAIFDAKGDLPVGTGANTAAKLTRGANGSIPVADDGETTGIKWALPDTDVIATDESTTSGSFTDLATAGPAVTVDIGDSGKALVILTCFCYADTIARVALMAYAVSGATTVGATIAKAIGHKQAQSTDSFLASGVWLHEGLTAGSNTFTAKYEITNGAGTANFLNRGITVIPL